MIEGGPPSFPPRLPGAALVAAFLLLAPRAGPADQAASPSRALPAPQHLAELTPDQLMEVEVTAVSKKPETRWRTPAAVSVITRDDIRRSGVTSIVEALRLVPGVQVSRIDANKWAVGIRGFADGLNRSLLVMIDGRSVYSPLFAGTYWEMQDVLLEDVERIEVIRGPGGSLWGANAVNGVINVITRSSRETRGAYATIGAGTQERFQLGLRYGGAAGDRFTYRVYGKGFERDPGFHASGTPFDSWSMGQGGFRVDWENGAADTVELHGDAYRGEAGNRVSLTSLTAPFVETLDSETRLRGSNLAARWRHLGAGGSEWGLRAYFDHTSRREANFGEGRDTLDVEAQRRAAVGRHDVVAGAGYRVTSGKVDGVPSLQFTPPRRTDHLWSGFFRDEMSFHEGRVVVAIGSKVEHNEYSGFEIQPTVQALWAPTPAHSLWALAARAVRTPSRLEHDLTLTTFASATGPVFVRLLGDPAFRPEKVLTLEAGYRTRVGGNVALYGVAFHNTHRDLFSLEQGTPFLDTSPPGVVVPVHIGNGVRGSSYGMEVHAQTTPRSWWHLGASYAFVRLDLEAAPGTVDVTHDATNRNAPRHTFLGESRMDLGPRVNLDLVLRRVGELAEGAVPAYTSLDARLAWRPRDPVELAVVGQNLLEPHHLEFINSGNVRVEARRGAYATVTWRP